MAGWGHPPTPLTAAQLPLVIPSQLCVVLNNVELVRRASGQALRGLAWPEGANGLEGVLPRPLLSCIQALDEDLQREAHTVTAHLTSKVGRGVVPGTCAMWGQILNPHSCSEHHPSLRWWQTSGSMYSTSVCPLTRFRMMR